VNGVLRQGQALCSSDGRFQATLQYDGNFVLYFIPWAKPYWWTSTNSATQLVMQSDCNLVLYDPTHAVAATGTNGRGTSCRAVMQSDGNFVVYRNTDGKALWSVATGPIP